MFYWTNNVRLTDIPTTWSKAEVEDEVGFTYFRHSPGKSIIGTYNPYV